MLYNYSPLWHFLEERRMTKGQLALSSATVARMTAGEPVNLDVIGHLCDLLQCRIEDILSIEPDVTSMRWQNIRPSDTFSLNAYFFLQKDPDFTAVYLYGYATPTPPCDDQEEEHWYLDFLGNSHPTGEAWKASKTLSGGALKRFLTLAAEGRDFRTSLELTTPPDMQGGKKTRNKKIQNAIQSVVINDGQLVYRPAFIQPLPSVYDHTAPWSLPLLSPNNKALYCESLFAAAKQNLYTDSDNESSNPSLLQIWDILTLAFPQWKNRPNEIARLGNFDVLYPLNEDNTEGIAIDVQKDFDTYGDPSGARSLIIQLDQRRLKGNFIVRVVLSNTRNPLIDNLYPLASNESHMPMKQIITIPENISHADISIWKRTGGGEGASHLIYQNRLHLIRQIICETSILERQFHIQDIWHHKVSKQHNVKHYISAGKISIPSKSSDEPWLQQEDMIQKDLRNRLCEPDPTVQSYSKFFLQAKGDETKVEAFLDWFKELLSQQNETKRVILIDPYINARALSKIIVNLNHRDIPYEIYTSAAEPNKEHSRLDDIRALSATLDYIAPIDFKVWMIKQGILHDRFLILSSKQPLVYMLSNSFDSMANQHSSAAIYCPPKVANEIFDHYAELIENLKNLTDTDNKKIQLIYDSQANDPSAKETPSEIQDSPQNEPTLNNFQTFFPSVPEQALSSLAYMHEDGISACRHFLAALDRQTLIDTYCNILNASLQKEYSYTKHDTERILTIVPSAWQNFDTQGRLLQCTEYLFEPHFPLFNITQDWSLYYAAQLLWETAPSVFCDFFATCIKKSPNLTSPISFPLNTYHGVIYTLMIQLIPGVENRVYTEEQLESLCKASTPWLRVAAAISLLQFPPCLADNTALMGCTLRPEAKIYIEITCEKIRQSFSAKEARLILVYLMQRLQIRIACVPESRENLQPLIDYVGDQAASVYKLSQDSPSIEQLQSELSILDFRGVSDHANLLDNLFRKKSLVIDGYRSALIKLILNIFEKEDAFYQVKDIDDAIFVLRYVDGIGLSALAHLQKNIQKVSYPLSRKLSDPFLEAQDYSVWKDLIDKFSCLIALDHEIGLLHPEDFPISKINKVFDQITSQVDEQLKEYSKVYVYAKQIEAERLKKTHSSDR